MQISLFVTVAICILLVVPIAVALQFPPMSVLGSLIQKFRCSIYLHKLWLLQQILFLNGSTSIYVSSFALD